MNDRSEISSPLTSPAIGSFTLSAASVSGPEPCETQASPTTQTSGQGPAHAKDGRKRVAKKASKTIGTSGPIGSGSSPPVDLLSSLRNRLRAKTDVLGSTLYSMIWREQTTPAKHTIYQLQASGRRTNDNGSTSWPTPVKEDARSSARHGYMIEGNAGTTLLDAARLTMSPPAPYPTPNASCATRGGHLSHMDGRRSNLMDTVKLMERPSISPPSLPAIASESTEIQAGRICRRILGRRRRMDLLPSHAGVRKRVLPAS